MKPTEAEDPYELVGTILPSPPGYDAQGEMARCFIEEFALMGWTGQRILRLFKNPFYQGPYAIYQTRGEEFVRDIIRQIFEGVEANA